MNWRSEFILGDGGLKDLFDDYKLDNDTIVLATVSATTDFAVDPAQRNLPAVSFGFGKNKATDGGTTEGESGRYALYVYAIVNKTEDKTLIERSGDMYSCVQQIVKSLRTLTFSTEDGYVDIQNVRILEMNTPEVKLSENDHMLFTIEVRYEEYYTGLPE